MKKQKLPVVYEDQSGEEDLLNSETRMELPKHLRKASNPDEGNEWRDDDSSNRM